MKHALIGHINLLCRSQCFCSASDFSNNGVAVVAAVVAAVAAVVVAAVAAVVAAVAVVC